MTGEGRVEGETSLLLQQQQQQRWHRERPLATPQPGITSATLKTDCSRGGSGRLGEVGVDWVQRLCLKSGVWVR